MIVGDDVEALPRLRASRCSRSTSAAWARAGKNFYNDLACRYGFEAAAKEIQDLYLDGKKDEAAVAVPDELVDEIALVGEGPDRGPPRRLARSGGDHDDHAARQPEALRLMAELTQ